MGSNSKPPILIAILLLASLGWAPPDNGLIRSLPSSTGLSGRAAQIRMFANRWLGTRYRWGGTSRSGIDCSAYLRQMYRDLFHVELPRTTRQQIRLGVDLSINPRRPQSGMNPGDLIFYIDRAGVPNHVVVYMGSGMITHSVSGRGVVIDPIRKIWGRRVVSRRLLVPSGEGGSFAPIPPAGPIVPKEIPCPPSVKPDRREVRSYAKKPIPDLRDFGEREICDFRVLGEALRKKGGKVAKQNAAKLEEHARWLESIEALQGMLGPK